MKKNLKRNLNVFLAGSLTVGVAAPVLPANVIASTVANDLIISEYIEGSSFNKALEIYNGTGAPIDLSNYIVELYSNGSTTPSQSVTLSGTIKNGATYVIYHGSAGEGIKSKGNLENSSVINFNGDDAIVLKNGETIIDSFGQVGVDPGTSWGTDVSSVNKTLVRKSSITAGDQNPNDAFDPAVEWSAYDIDSFAYLGSHVMGEDTPTPTPTPIESTITDVRKLPLGSSVSTTGVVTAVLGGTTYIQDETSGIVLYGFDLNVEPGDKVHVSGTLAEFRSLLQINVKPQDVEVLEKSTVAASEVIRAGQLQESYEGKLVTIQNVTIESLSNGNYIAKDAEGTSFELRPSDSSLLSVGTTYESVTGVLGSYNDVYQLIPRDANDVIEDSTIVRPVVASPGEGLIEEGTKVTLTTGTEGATIYYTTDDSVPTTASEIYNEPISITEDTTIKAIAVKEGFTTSDVAEFNYIIQLDDIRIHDIQGEGHYSKYDGQNVTGVEGIVTYVNGNEFYMQDLQPDNNDKTSEGILVYKRSHGVEVGDVVTVSGEVKEWVLEGYSEKRVTDLPVTEINATEVIEIANDQELPEPIVIGEDRLPPTEVIDNDHMTEFEPEEDGIDFFESLEGMLVQVDNPKVVAPQKYGELTVIPGTIATNTIAGGLRISETDYNPERIMIDINDENYVAKMGDYFNGSIKGVVSYGFSNFKVLSYKSELPTLIEGPNTRETTSITPEEDKLTIATYNVENFSTKTDDAKVTKLAEAITLNMKTPDIIGLTEVQDNDGATDSGVVDANESAQILIDKIVALGGPRYVYTDVAPENKQDGGAPGGNIRVGFLYNPERVTLSEGVKGTARDAVEFENGKLTLNPGRIDPTNAAFEDSRKPLAAQFEFNGENVVVVANHFNSKGGDQPLFGKNQPPTLSSEIQRMEIATIVNGFVKDILEKDPDANVVLVGDFNDFEFSNPLLALKGNELTNMIEFVPEEERFTYSYQGNAQVLDHILVSNNLTASTTVDIVHINSSFMEQHGRASDHDPVMVQIDFTDAEPVQFDKVYDYKNLTKKKLTIPQKKVWIQLDAKSKVNEILFKGEYVELQGEGFKHTNVKFAPKKPNAILELNDTEVKKVILDGANVSEVRGAKKGQVFEYINGANKEDIQIN